MSCIHGHDEYRNLSSVVFSYKVVRVVSRKKLEGVESRFFLRPRSRAGGNNSEVTECRT